MVIIGVLLAIMVISSALVLSACMLSGQRSQMQEHGNKSKLEMSGRWSGTTFGGRYTSTIPHCRFEPEDLEEVQVVHRF